MDPSGHAADALGVMGAIVADSSSVWCWNRRRHLKVVLAPSRVLSVSWVYETYAIKFIFIYFVNLTLRIKHWYVCKIHPLGVHSFLLRHSQMETL